MSSNRLFFDCQTNGSSSNYGQMIEVAWRLEKDSGELIQSESHFIKLRTGQELPPRIARITGITSDDLIDGITEKELFKILSKLSRNYPFQWIIHYDRFEKNFLQDLFQRFSKRADVPGDFVCTHKLSKTKIPSLPSHSIHAVSGHLGHSVDKLKRSREHVNATKFIYDALSSRKPLSPAPRSEGKNYIALIDKETRLAWPRSPGVYKMYAKDKKLLYVGKAKDLKARLNSYFRGQKSKGSRLNEMLSQVQKVDYIILGSEEEALVQECFLINELKPKYNILMQSKGATPTSIHLFMKHFKQDKFFTVPSSPLMALQNLIIENNTESFLLSLFRVTPIKRNLKLLLREEFEIKSSPSDLSELIHYSFKLYWHSFQTLDTRDWKTRDLDWDELFEQCPDLYIQHFLHHLMIDAAKDLARSKWLSRLSEATLRLHCQNKLFVETSLENGFIKSKGADTKLVSFGDSGHMSRSAFTQLSMLFSLLKGAVKKRTPIELDLKSSRYGLDELTGLFLNLQ